MKHLLFLFLIISYCGLAQSDEMEAYLVKKKNGNKFSLPEQRRSVVKLTNGNLYRGVLTPTSESTFQLTKKKGTIVVLDNTRFDQVEYIKVARLYQAIYSYTLLGSPIGWGIVGLVAPDAFFGGGNFEEAMAATLIGAAVAIPAGILTLPLLLRHKYKSEKWDFLIVSQQLDN